MNFLLLKMVLYFCVFIACDEIWKSSKEVYCGEEKINVILGVENFFYRWGIFENCLLSRIGWLLWGKVDNGSIMRRRKVRFVGIIL